MVIVMSAFAIGIIGRSYAMGHIAMGHASMGMMHGSMMHDMHSSNMSDSDYIAMMIPHHQGAVEMSKIALTKAQRDEVRQIAQRIIADQTNEIQQLTAWYQSWYGTKPPAPTMMMDMSDHMDDLKNADNFDQKFIEAMSKHHSMAIEMSIDLAMYASHKELRDFANNVITNQSREISELVHHNHEWYQ